MLRAADPIQASSYAFPCTCFLRSTFQADEFHAFMFIGASFDVRYGQLGYTLREYLVVLQMAMPMRIFSLLHFSDRGAGRAKRSPAGHARCGCRPCRPACCDTKALQKPFKVGLALAIASLWFVLPSLMQQSLGKGVWIGVTYGHMCAWRCMTCNTRSRACGGGDRCG